MKLRWSNGHSFAVEFEANTPGDMERAIGRAIRESGA